MAAPHLKIAFVRRGYSASGGAEAYLKRLARGVAEGGHEAHLFATDDWPANEWSSGSVTRIKATSPSGFADEVERRRGEANADVLMSLERIWRCDLYRAGDGVHRAWLERRAQSAGALQKLSVALNPKHRETLRLEASLFGANGARRLIANSQLVKDEIARFYNYPAERIEVVANGVPTQLFRPSDDQRAASRAALQLATDDIAILFVGSGWERKGLGIAIEAVERCGDPHMKVLVAGKGNEAAYRCPAARFLGVVHDLPPLYAAADIFLLPTIYDPFSNASLEAAAAGLPVITTRANGFAEIIEDGVHGSAIANPGDVAAFSAALSFWSDRRRRGEARPKILELASRYDIATNVARTLEILLQAAASAAPTSGKIRKT